VIDRSVTRPVCANCGAFTLPAGTLERVELRAVIVAFKDAPQVTGAMLKFARKALGLKQTELAERLGVVPETISHWEREARKIEQWVPLAVLNFVRERLMPEPTGVELRKTA
jgi:DNA-binding transcriptional regulator YiaG